MNVPRLGPEGTYSARALGPPDLTSLQRLFERAADYFEIATGAKPAPDEAERAFVGGPPTKAVGDKRTIGVFDQTGRLVGVLDAIPDFPAEGTCTIGMLLLDPDVRDQGLGTAALTAFEGRMAAAGQRRFRTAVVARHPPGAAFLEGRGYREVSRSPSGAASGTPTVIFFEKAAPGA